MPRETTKVTVALPFQIDLLTGIRLLAVSTGRGGPASHHRGELGHPHGRIRAQSFSGQSSEIADREGMVEELLGDHDLEGTHPGEA